MSKKTCKRYWVDAKVRGVEGLLGKTEKNGGKDRDALSRLIPHLNGAFKKPAEDDRLIFIDINGGSEPTKDAERAPAWIDRAVKRLEQYEMNELPEGEDAYVFVTNLPFHRMLNEPLSIGVYLSGSASPISTGRATLCYLQSARNAVRATLDLNHCAADAFSITEFEKHF